MSPRLFIALVAANPLDYYPYRYRNKKITHVHAVEHNPLMPSTLAV
jgi:hypothetical protein